VERAYIGARLSRLLGVAVAGDDGATLGREELFAGWRLFLERLAAVRPVVLLIEDAQHADTGLLDFLDHLIDWTRDLPIYVLIFARPELGQARPGFGAGRNRSTLTLDPLDAASMDQLVDALVPGMPPAARARITSQAQGVPLFAVETIRALIDRDIVQPVEGVYRLTGDLGELVVPDSLHALLAARLDALDPAVRQLAADAAVLGSSFPAEALTAVSGRDITGVRAGLAELLRREVLTVSADPLSPEQGSYQFAQEMLRQVAYDTLSRRDRKTRHLAVAAHLRAAFAGDGEEVADVIARHYLDALSAIPDDADTPRIRGQAIAALIRAAERAKRTGAPDRAAASYATAAELKPSGPSGEPPHAAGDLAGNGPRDTGTLWERAAEAAADGDSWATAIEYAGHARQHYLRQGQLRAAARAQVIKGRSLRLWGRYAEARSELAAAIEVLRTDPDTDTVNALEALATLEIFAGSPDADQLTAEVLILGQALDVGTEQFVSLFVSRGIYLCTAGRRLEGISYLREGARLATQVGNTLMIGRALLNMSDPLAITDPAASAEVARTATEHLRRAGSRDHLAIATTNLVQALLQLGHWDAAEAELTEAMDSYGLTEVEFISCYRGWLAALRGDAATAETLLAALRNLRASEDTQDKALISTAAAFTAAARRNPAEALRHARAALAYATALGISFEMLRWAWPLAVRAAYELGDATATGELLALLDTHQPGHVAPVLRAERDLARARLAARDGEAVTAFAVAITSLRERGTPYHLAHGLLDHAEYLLRTGAVDAASSCVEEARAIGSRLACQPLLDRAGALDPVGRTA
jgi:hypothetical protein